MIIMIIFLVLTVIFVIGTIVYLNYKKKKDRLNTTIKAKEKGLRKNKKKLQSLFEFEIIDDIVRLGNRFSKILKLGSVDYNILSEKEQTAIEDVLIQTISAVDYPIQFFTTTEYIDTSKIISTMKNDSNDNMKIAEYRQFLKQYLYNLMENRTISIIKNYVIISYDGLYENAIKELDINSTNFKNNLLKANIVCEILDNDSIIDLMYRELNKNDNQHISKLQKGENKLYVKKKK